MVSFMQEDKGRWINIHGSMISEKAYGTCSICHRESELKTEPYYLCLDVIGLNKCPHCNSEMEFYYREFS